MKRYIKSNYDFDSIVDNINLLIESGTKSLYEIIQILDGLPIGTRLRVATDSSLKRTTYFDRTESGWEDSPYSYSSYDIADELINGKFNYVFDIKYLKPINQKYTSDRYKPKLWR